MTLLPITYFGPVGWWNLLLKSNDIVFDIYENYIKQTFRNRCSILSANGVLNLIIPVKKINGNHTILKNIKIENNQHWQSIHYKTVMSAYKASPFYDYYIDDIYPIWTKQYEFLVDVCFDSINIISNILNKKLNIQISKYYIETNKNNNITDYRKNCTFDNIKYEKYNQVFNDRFEFVPNLSILDQLFNDDNINEKFI